MSFTFSLDRFLVKEYDHFLEEEFLYKAQQLAQQKLHKGFNFRTNAQWHSDIVKSSATVLIAELDDQEILDHLDKQIKDKIGDYVAPEPMIYYWPPGSYIPWHDDHGHAAAVTIYLSHHDINDGGYFMYKEGTDIKALKPDPGKAIFAKDVEHCVTTLNLECRVRRTIQCFLKKA
jgi:hypothetical protein